MVQCTLFERYDDGRDDEAARRTFREAHAGIKTIAPVLDAVLLLPPLTSLRVCRLRRLPFPEWEGGSTYGGAGLETDSDESTDVGECDEEDETFMLVAHTGASSPARCARRWPPPAGRTRSKI